MTEDLNQPNWQAESTHPELIEVFRERMREVIDPEIGLNIIELGLVRDLVIEDQGALITMIMTTPFCPYAPALLEMTRQKGETALQRPTTIEMGIQMWTPAMMEDGTAAEWGLF